MRRSLICVLMIPLLLLAGCGGGEGSSAEEQALAVRTRYLAMTSFAGSAEVTADYGERVYDFTMDFSWEKDGDLVLTVTSPEEISGITARVRDGETLLEYDGASLGAGDLSGDGLSPVEAIPAILDDARSGCITQCVLEQMGEQETLRVEYGDPRDPEGLTSTLWFDPSTGALLRSELFSDGYLVITCVFTSFSEQTGDDQSGRVTDENMG